jgi:hypothetical protein
MRKLESLHLLGCGLTEEALRMIARSKTLKSLKNLTLDVPRLTMPTVEEVIASAVTRGLEYFFIGTQGRPGDGARGEELFRLHFGDEILARLKAHYGECGRFERLEWHY